MTLIVVAPDAAGAPALRVPAPLRTARLLLRTMIGDDVDDIHADQSRADACR